MKAKVLKRFKGAPDGQIYPRDYAVGDEVAGHLAVVAVKEGWAEEIKERAEPAKPVKNEKPSTTA